MVASRWGSWCLVAGWLWLWLVVARPPAVLANAGPPVPPVRPGAAFTEPLPVIEGIVIEHEVLTLDLRPVADGRAAVVDATYRLHNDGAARSVDLVFIAAALGQGDSLVQLDDQPVAFTTERLPVNTLPPSWRPPGPIVATDWQPKDPTYNVPPAATGALRFQLALAPGVHTVHVHYQALPTQLVGSDPTIAWSLDYVLAPARSWAGFGGLAASVTVPPGWSATVQPGLSRRGDTLTGTWDALPADALTITVQAPFWPPSLFAAAVAIPGLAFGAAVGWWLGRRRYRRHAGLQRAVYGLLLGAGFGLVGASLMVLVLSYGASLVSPAQRPWRLSGYFGEDVEHIMVFAPLMCVAAPVVTLLGLLIAATTGRRRSPAVTAADYRPHTT